MNPGTANPGRDMRDQRAYRLAEAAVNATLSALALLRRWKARLAEERALASLRRETRHMDEHLLRDVGLWDRLR